MIACSDICYCLYSQLRIPLDIAVRAEKYAAAKILLDARGGPVSEIKTPIEFLILMCTCDNDWADKNKPHTGVTALTYLCMLTSIFVAWKFMCTNHYNMLNWNM